MITRSAAAVVVLGVIGCGPDTARVILDPLGVESCRRYCVETLEIELDGRSITAACGEAIDLGEIEAGRSATLAVRAQGGGSILSGQIDVVAASGEALEVQVSLEPAERPIISRVHPERSVLFGPTEVEIVGVGFGSGAGSEAWLGGQPAEVLEWSDTRVRARATASGDVSIVRCGVSSATASAELRSIGIDVTTPLPPPCGAGLLRATDARFTDSGNAVVGLFECGQSGSCDALLARLEPTVDTTGEYWGPFSRCAIDFGLYDSPDLLLATDAGLAHCRQLSGHRLECAARDTGSGRVVGVAAIGAALGTYTLEPAPSAPRELWLSTSTRTARLFEAEVSDVAAIDGRYFLGRNRAGAPALYQWQSRVAPELAQEIPLVSCDAPLFVTVNRPIIGPNPRLMVACQDAAGSTVLGFDLARGSDPVSITPVAGFTPDAGALTLDGTVAVLMSVGGELVFVDLDAGRVLGRRALPPRFAGAALARAPASDHFLLGGPGPGEVTWIDAAAP